MTPFLKKTTLFRNFAHKMQSGGIFLVLTVLVRSVLQ